VDKNFDKNTAHRINEIFSNTGVNAGIIKLSYVLRIDPERAVRDISSKYGNVIRSMSEAK
jgi:hypothetical protein